MGITSNSPSKIRKVFLNTKQLLAQTDKRENRFIAAPAQSQLTFSGLRAPALPLTTSYKAPVPSECLQSFQAWVPKPATCSRPLPQPDPSKALLQLCNTGDFSISLRVGLPCSVLSLWTPPDLWVCVIRALPPPGSPAQL